MMSMLFWNLNRKKIDYVMMLNIFWIEKDAEYISITMDILSCNLNFVLVQYEYYNFLINLMLFIVIWDLDNIDI